ncbi:MAG: hypothetical protein EAZ08_09950 [Cytophagales bacterium]|nr:MAG: hypothetical protein EAZ08_09950 [Cytophagales bacterium]
MGGRKKCVSLTNLFKYNFNMMNLIFKTITAYFQSNLFVTNKTYIISFYLIVCGLGIDTCFGQKMIHVENDFVSWQVEPANLLWLADSTESVGVESILEGKYDTRMQPINNLNLGYNHAKHWFKIKVFVEKPQTKLLLEVESLFEIANLYYQRDDSWQKQIYGIRQPFSKRPIQYRNFVYPLDFDKRGMYILYLEIQAQASVQVRATLQKQDYFQNHIAKSELFYGIFYGSILIMFFYNIFLFFSLKELTYLYYCIMLLISIWVQFVINGHYLYLFGENAYWIERSDQFVFMLIMSNIWLAMRFLETQKHSLLIHILFMVLMALNFIFALVGFVLPISLVVILTSLSILTSVLTLISSAFILYFRGAKQARFFITAWVVYLLAAVLMTIKNLGILPSNFFTQNSIQIGSILQVLFLSFALSDKINILKQEKSAAEKQALKTLQEKQKIIETQNQILAQKVAEKTKDLQLKNEALQTTEEELRQNMEELETSQELLREQKKTIETAFESLNRQNQKVNDSIRYAQRIQNAILPHEDILAKAFSEHFVIFKPKDVVSGDFYWYLEVENKKFLAVIDCTGHGVPGAFMSMIGNTLLNEIINTKNILAPHLVLEQLHIGIMNALNKAGAKIQDGMDIALCCIENEGSGNVKVQFSGAKRHLYYFSNQQLAEIQGDRKSIGHCLVAQVKYTTHEVMLHSGDTLYMSTDGWVDSINPARKRFGSQQFKEMLLKGSHLPLNTQEEVFRHILEDYEQGTEQRDDVLLVGVRV